MSIREDEIMGLYAIARDELDGVTAACERLDKSIRRLEGTGRNVESNAQTGVRAALSNFDYEFRKAIGDHVGNASFRLEKAVEFAKKELRQVEMYYLIGVFLFGVILGAGCLWWLMYERMKNLELGQDTIYREILSLKHAPKAQKPKVKHRRPEATQSNEAPEDGEGLVGGESETK